ncbi:MAG: 3-phosphoserine/phosphohydroxythreonine transaminase [Spirochaetia bacterium]
MGRVYNFSAGPSILPESVLEQASREMLDYRGSGMSVMEMSHRSKVFAGIMEEALAVTRELFNIPEDYTVLFLQGGATLQFSMVPLNLLSREGKAGFIDTGSWSQKAFKEASRFGNAAIIASSKDENYTFIPKIQRIEDDFDYIHITSNNTIYGTRFMDFPDTKDVPLVADMSSNIGSEPFDVSKFGLIYAGAQKNLGPAGVTLVIIRNDLIGKEQEKTPIYLQYKIHAEKDSLYNTPPAYSTYVMSLVLQYLKKEGGLEEIGRRNREKADILYNFIDNSSFYRGTVRKEDRSLMNIPFVLEKDELTPVFLEEAEKNGLVNLKGHRSVGGVRASIYNAMPTAGVKKLVDFMKNFEQEKG